MAGDKSEGGVPDGALPMKERSRSRKAKPAKAAVPSNSGAGAAKHVANELSPVKAGGTHGRRTTPTGTPTGVENSSSTSGGRTSPYAHSINGNSDSHESAAPSAHNNSAASPLPIALDAESKRARWHDWWLRHALAYMMIAGFLALLYWGRQPGVVLLVFVCQGFIYKELVSIAIIASKETQMPGFSLFYYYWFGVCAYYMYTKTLQVHIVAALTGSTSAALTAGASPLLDEDDPSFLQAQANEGLNATLNSALAEGGAAAFSAYGGSVGGTMGEALFSSGMAGVRAYPALVSVPLRALAVVITQYVPIAFALYVLGFMAFVISLRQRRNFKYQFSQFAYCHIALATVVVQSTFLLANAYRGLIWFLLPIGLVVVNDSFAYIFGFFFGRTPLIKRLSPKKTWEGFVGGAISSFVFAVMVTGAIQALSDDSGLKQSMLCPVERGLGFKAPHCDMSTVFEGLYVPHPLSSYSWMGWLSSPSLAPSSALSGDAAPLVSPGFLRLLLGPIASYIGSLRMSRMQLHGLALAAFASAVAPFGGFFASGFKRAFKVRRQSTNGVSCEQCLVTPHIAHADPFLLRPRADMSLLVAPLLYTYLPTCVLTFLCCRSRTSALPSQATAGSQTAWTARS